MAHTVLHRLPVIGGFFGGQQQRIISPLPASRTLKGAGGTYNPPPPPTFWQQSPEGQRLLQRQVLGSQAPTGGGGGTAPSQPQSFFIQEPGGPPQESLDVINQLYEETIGAIEPLERITAEEQEAQIRQTREQQPRLTTRLRAEETEKLGAVSREEEQARRQETSALEQLRQLQRETETGQAAQLSARGLASSSAAEALASILGREMAQRVAGVTGTTREILTNLSRERTKVQNFVSDALTELERDTQERVGGIQREFGARTAQLRALRGQAAVAKQQARADLFNTYQQNLLEIRQANAQAQLALQQFQIQTQAKINQSAQNVFQLPITEAQQLGISGEITGLEPTTGMVTLKRPRLAARQPSDEDIVNQILQQTLPGTAE